MLQSFREHLTGLPVKILLVILIGAFAVWGIGDVFRGGLGGDTVARVGSQEISTAELRRAFERSYRDLQQRMGGAIDRRQAIQFGLMQQSLQQLVAERLVAAHAADLGFVVPDSVLLEHIRGDPVFRAGDGFDRSRVALVARSQGMTEDQLLETIRAELVRQHLIRALTAPVAAPDVLARQLWLHANETRRGRALVVLANAIEVPPPDDATLAAYLEAHAADWQTPELRGLTIVELRPADFADEIEVTEEQLRAEYDMRIEEFRDPERREVTQILAPDRAAAEDAAALVASGKSFADAAAMLAERGVTSERLGAMRREQLPDGLADAVFALAPGGVSAPVESAFGWHLFELEAVLPEQTRPFAAVRDDLARELRLRAAADRLPDLANRLEDAIAEGVSLEEAASRVGVPVREIAAVTAQGNDADERPLAQPVAAEILSVAFDTPSGETSVVGETPDGGYFVVRVDRIEPATTKPLTEIRDRLAAAWAVAERRQRARQQADALRSRAAAGESLESLQAATPGSELRAVGPLRRDDPGTSAKLTPEAVELLFATPAGAVAERVVEALDGAGVLVTDTIERGDPPPDLGPLRERLAAMLQGDLLDQYAGALRERYRPTVNETLLGTLMRTDEG